MSKTGANEAVPIDLAIANEDKLIEMLKKKGTIPQDATAAEAEKALQQYLHKLAEASAANKETDSFAKKRAALADQIKSNMNSNGVYKGNGNKSGEAKQTTISSVKKENWDGTQRKDEVLVLLIDFPDLKHGQLSPDETDMYYSGSDAYSHQHYQDMIFGEDGYVGPDGKTKISMKQFYEQQSGGSYTVDGQVAGWYTAEHEAAYYGAHNSSGNDVNPRALVREALNAAAKDPSVNLNRYDQEDQFDLNGDGNTREPDGIIDHLMVIHSGVGEEAGGGKIGENAIWSHSSSLINLYPIPDTTAEANYFGVDNLIGFAYTIEPEDGAAGVFAHEFAHDLGYPDEYDTIYSGSGEPVSNWSIMSSGSWTGKIPGTEPSGFSPNAKAFFQESMTTSTFTPNWLSGTNINLSDVTSKGTSLLLDEASTKGTNNDVVRINLPDKVNVINAPKTGSYEYFGGKGDEIDHKMVKAVDLTGVTANATLDFDAWYKTEENWDFAMVQVSEDNGGTWKSLSTEQTTDSIVDDGYPAIKQNMPGYTGSSNGWIHQTIDLSAYKGKEIQLQFRYMTDWGTSLEGFFVDNVKVTADGKEVLTDGAEGDPLFTLHGFGKHTGSYATEHHYLLEWRTHNGSDSGLANINRRGTMLSFDSGLVVWYVDDSYDNNWTGTGFHPGDGFVGVVDADQHNNIWQNKNWTDPNDLYQINKLLGSNSYQMHDAAFSLNKGSNVTIGDSSFYMKDNFTQNNALFDDSQDYSNPQNPEVGRNVPKYGLKVRVVGQSADGTVGKILIFK
ncbi:protease [Paenibacillus montanisoli]|uniref:Protease n=2 Tax=Paenibacillus montanisoli TaxID=2081970 RepID=A0A328TSE2_9BACL|nr:protease [Paenibacillus montanisoli]